MFILMGILSNFYYASLNALVTIFFKRKVESLFRLEAMYQLGFMIGPIVGGFLTLQYGIEIAFYTWAGLGIAGLVLSSFILRKRELATDKKRYGGLWSEMRKRKLAFFIFLLIGGVITGLLDSIRDLGVPLYATGLGMNIYEVGLLFGISSVISFVGFFLLGKKLEKVNKNASLIATMVLMAVPFFMFALFQDILTLAVLTGVFTLGRAGGLNIARAFVSDNVSIGTRASGIALIDSVYYIGRVTGPLYAGAVIDIASIPFVFFTGGVVSLAGIGIVAAYWALRR
jgi:MFS family permease